MTVDPAQLRLQIYPADVLRRKADPVDVTPETRAVAERMVEVMRESEGIGLAGPQIGLSWRLFVCHVPPDDERSPDADPPTACTEPRAFINPEILKYDGPPEPYEEGCLSLPGILGEVLRPPIVTVRALGLDGKPFEARAAGLLARCWQHEIDHLDGVLIIDKFTQVSRLKNRSAVRNLEKRVL
ncbi:MAG: peptide deformylase [Phycisphaerales bacterium]